MLRLLLLLLAIAFCTQPTQGAWPDEQAAGPFIWHSDHALTAHAALIAELPRLQQDLSAKLALPAPRERIHVFVFAKKETYEAYLKQHFPKAPARRAVFLKGRGPGMVFAYRSDELVTDLRHECTHALLHAALPDLPLWLDEGLAEYFETPANKQPTASPHRKIVESMVRNDQLPRLESLETISDLGQFAREEYRDAWAWIHFLLEGTGEGPQILRNYLAELRNSRDVGPLSESVRRSLPHAERQLAQHFLTMRNESARSAVR